MEEILLAKASALKVEVPNGEIETAFTQARANLSEEAFQQELTKRNLTAADMREGLRRQLITQKLITQEVSSKVAVTDQQITDFFNANRAQFNFPEDAYHLAQIVVTPVRDAQVTNRSGDDANTPQAAAAKVGQLMERLKAGATFGDLARDFSEDPESAPRGGDLGMVPLSAVKQAAPPLRDAVLQMTPGNARVVSQGGAHSIVVPGGLRGCWPARPVDARSEAAHQRRTQGPAGAAAAHGLSGRGPNRRGRGELPGPARRRIEGQGARAGARRREVTTGPVGTASPRAETKTPGKDGNPIHIAVTRQGARVRVYYNEEKMWDVPRALLPAAK